MTRPTVDDLIGMEMDVYHRAMEGVLAKDEDGKPILCDGEPLFAPDLMSANHALENMARLCGVLVDRREVTICTGDGAEAVTFEAIEGGKGGISA